MRSFMALALNGFREARRNRVSVVVALFALGMLMASTLVTEVTVFTFQRVLVDVGLGAMTLALVLLAIFLSSGLLSREIERRTIFIMMSKPISRGLFLTGRLAGNMLTLASLLGAMGGLFLLEVLTFNQLSAYEIGVTAPLLVAMGMLLMELLVITCVGFLMSSFATQTVSAVVTVGIYLAGHLASDIYTLAERSQIPGVPLVGKAVYYLMPNLDRLNYRPMASHNILPPLTETLQAVAYGLGYSGVLVALAVLIFNRRDFK